ncbi:nucleoside triphosphate pyrophosphohydrolase [bacterium]|nr:nucleoside triphosphate pyrophosphohydrolase [bacterium]
MPTLPQAALEQLWRTLERLLAPDGCPWDREQRLADIARHLIDEGHEWLEACNQGDRVGQVEELGDLAYLPLFGLQRLARDEGEAAAAGALQAIDAKLRRRHPQLFPAPGGAAGPMPADSAEQLRVWEAVKREERAARGEAPGLLKPLPRSLSVLARSQRYQETAAGVGFDWPDLAGVLAKLDEEVGELRAALAALPAAPPPGAGAPSSRYRAGLSPATLAQAQEELGDLFIVLANLSRWLGLDAEALAESANAKFRRRFAAMEARLAADGERLGELSLETMDRAWQAVKNAEAAGEES